MLDDILGAGNHAANLWAGSVGSNPTQLQAMSAEQMAEYMRRQGDPTNGPWELRWQADAFRRATNIAIPHKPTMTLAEWDVRRAAFGREKLG